jgi:formiminotetrahydrofolate cyclodeaminase
LESVASIDLQKSTREGRKLKKKQLAISEEETTKAGIDVLSSAKKHLKRVNGTAENKILQRAVAIDDGEKASVQVSVLKIKLFQNPIFQFKSEKSLVFSSDANGSTKIDHHIRFSIDDDVAAFKALMNKRHNRKAEKSKLAAQKSLDELGRNGTSLRSSNSLLDENDDDSLLQAQQDAFDFSLLK